MGATNFIQFKHKTIFCKSFVLVFHTQFLQTDIMNYRGWIVKGITAYTELIIEDKEKEMNQEPEYD
jgi:hypothetical protein